MWCDDLWTLQLASDENFSASYPIPIAHHYFSARSANSKAPWHWQTAFSYCLLGPWWHMVTIQIRGFFHVFYHHFFPRNEVPLCSANLALRFHADPKADEKNHVCFRSINHAWFETVLEVLNHCLKKKLASFCFDIFRFYFCDWYSHKESQTTPKRVYGWISLNTLNIKSETWRSSKIYWINITKIYHVGNVGAPNLFQSKKGHVMTSDVCPRCRSRIVFVSITHLAIAIFFLKHEPNIGN